MALKLHDVSLFLNKQYIGTMDVVRYDLEASGLYVELKFDSCPWNIPACFFVRFLLIFSLGMQRVWMNRWASACRHVNRRPRQLHHPDSVLGRILVDVWQPLPLSYPLHPCHFP